jgi:hypothetical protein
MFIERLKKIFGIKEKPEITEQNKIEEVKEEIRKKDEDHIKIVGEDDPVLEEMLNRVWRTGKAHIANVDDKGNAEFTELD